MDDRHAHARRALEHVCARGDLDAARDLYQPDFIDHVNRLDFRGRGDRRIAIKEGREAWRGEGCCVADPFTARQEYRCEDDCCV